jgi:hypothetical protein
MQLSLSVIFLFQGLSAGRFQQKLPRKDAMEMHFAGCRMGSWTAACKVHFQGLRAAIFTPSPPFYKLLKK